MKFQSKSRSVYSSSRPSSSFRRSSAMRSVKSPTGIGRCIVSAEGRGGKTRGEEERGERRGMDGERGGGEEGREGERGGERGVGGGGEREREGRGEQRGGGGGKWRERGRERGGGGGGREKIREQ